MSAISKKNAILAMLKVREEEKKLTQKIDQQSEEIVDSKLNNPNVQNDLKIGMGLENVENKSSAVIRQELTLNDITRTNLSASDVGAETPDGAQERVNNRLNTSEKQNLLAGNTLKGDEIFTTANKPTASDVGLGNVDNKSASTILKGLSVRNITDDARLRPQDIGAETPAGAQSKIDSRLTEAEKNQLQQDINDLDTRVGDIEDETPQLG